MTPSTPAQIEIRGLTKRYNRQTVLRDLSLTVADGDFCVLVGANGAGKTTLLRILATLVRPDAGEITIGQESLWQDPATRQKLGYVGHTSLFYSDLNAMENLRHYARLYGLPDAERRAAESIQAAGLAPDQAKPIRTYSRGMQQRLAIARALLHDPAVLLLDEPYTGLDPDAARWLDGLLQEWRSPGRAILLAAHRPQRLLPLATQVAWLKGGQIAEAIPVSELTDHPDLHRYLLEVI